MRRLLPLSLLVAAACGGDDDGPSRSCTTTAECPAGQICLDNFCVDNDTPDATTDVPGVDVGPAPTLESIRIVPDMAELTSIDGSMPEQDFDVEAVFSDGSTGAITNALFEIDPLSLGDIDPVSGTFIANGLIGGAATITATASGLSATAMLSVRLERNIIGPGASTDTPALFDAPPVMDEARRAGLVYPIDGAVMPQNVYPADVQWLVGTTGDAFRITLEKPSAIVRAYLVDDGTLGNHWLVDTAAWRALAQSDPDDVASVTVDRVDSATSEHVAGSAISVRFARAALTGSVYYWDIARGRIIRIDDGTADRVEFMPNPQLGCVGCHTVSPSGRYMAGRLGGGENTGTVYDLTTDLTGNPPPTIFPVSTLNWWFSSWSPDETRLVVSQQEGGGPNQMAIYDPIAGTQVPVTGALPNNMTHPAWSPDGTQIAYVTNIGPTEWGGINTLGDIAVIDVTAPDTFGGTTILQRGTDLAGDMPPGNASSYPTWSPDSALISFAHGNGSRSDTHQSALYLMNRDGTNVVRMDAASPGIDNYQPRFSPFQEGGYYWMSFLSKRDYGNTVVGTRGANRQQIWVTAIRTDAAPGEDASSPPYWVSGQNTASQNISAYWAPRPCRPDGESCTVGSECCGGDCRPDDEGMLVCSPPPPERCRLEGETCGSTDDCCEGLECFGNVCIPPIG